MDYNSINQRLRDLHAKKQKLDEHTGFVYVKSLRGGILGPDERTRINSITVLAKALEFLPKSDQVFSLFDTKLFSSLFDVAAQPEVPNETLKAVLHVALIFLWGVLALTKSANMYDPLLWNAYNNHMLMENLATKLAEQDPRVARGIVDVVAQLLFRTYELQNSDVILSEIRCLLDVHFFDNVSSLPYEFKSRLESFDALCKSSRLILRFLSSASLRKEPFVALINECIVVMARMINETGNSQKGRGTGSNSMDYSKVGLSDPTVDPQSYIQHSFSSVSILNLIYMLRNPNMTFKKNFSEHTMFASEKTYFPLLKFAVGITRLLNHIDVERYQNFALVVPFFDTDLYYGFMSCALKFWMASKAEQDDFHRIMTILETMVDYCDSMMRSDPFYTVCEQVVDLKYSEIKKYQLEKLRRGKVTSWSKSMQEFNETISQQVLDFVKTQRFLELSKGSWVYIANPLDKEGGNSSSSSNSKPTFYFLVLSSNNKSLIYKEFTRKHAHTPNVDKDGIVIDFKNIVKVDSKSMNEDIYVDNLINVPSRLNVNRIDIYKKDGNVFSFFVDNLGMLYAWLDGLKMLLNDNSALSEDTMYQIEALTKIRTNIQLIDLADRNESRKEVKYDPKVLESLSDGFYYE